MFILAHLSDPHLAPLPTPRLVRRIDKPDDDERNNNKDDRVRADDEMETA